MRHPDEGVLRRLADEPAGVADADRAHVADCPVCLVALDDVRDDAAAVGAALRAGSTADVDVDAAWARLTATQPRTAAVRAPAGRRRWGAVLRRPAVAALGFVAVVTGAGVAAANDWLPIFATEEIEPVAVSSVDLNAVPDLTDYGTVELTGDDGPEPVADAAAAEELTGLEAPEVTALPGGVRGDPEYQAIGEVAATFTFSAERAAQAAAEAGGNLPPVPPGLDGARVRLTAGPGLAAVWTGDSGAPALVVARAVAPAAFASSGVDFDQLRDYLLSLPGLPEEVAAQLSSFSPDASTLPLPVPAEYATSAPAEVNGEQATLLTSRDGFLAAVVWVEDGAVTAVAGSLTDDEVLTVASGLR